MTDRTAFNNILASAFEEAALDCWRSLAVGKRGIAALQASKSYGSRNLRGQTGQTCSCTVHVLISTLETVLQTLRSSGIDISFMRMQTLQWFHSYRLASPQHRRLGLKATNHKAMSRDSSAETTADQREGLHFRVGIVSDVQYADIQDGHSFLGVPRYYRASLDGLQRAISGWQEQQVEFGIQFGDLIDGFNPKDQSEKAMQTVLTQFAKLQKPVYHMIGNHCLYNLPRQRLNEVLGIQGMTSYYSFSPHQAWRFVVIDAYDVSMLGWPEGHPLHTQAKAILDERNINEVGSVLCAIILTSVRTAFVA